MVNFLVLAAVFSHCFVRSIPLDGTWEMSYSPYEIPREVRVCPGFSGVPVENAVPGYWEDMFSGSGYRVTPLYRSQEIPMDGTPEDMTLPNIYGSFLYRKTVRLEHGGEALLRFEGVRNQVHVWVNGRFVAFRQGFSTPFEIVIPDGVLVPGDNTLLLGVSNCPNLGYCDYVSGLTTRSVFGGTGGINGHLELAFPENDISDVYVTTSDDLKTITVHVSGDARYHWEISGVKSGDGVGDITVPTDGMEYWSDRNPKLYSLVLSSGGRTFVQSFGIRRLQAEGEKLMLNGSPVFLRGVTEHCYHPATVHLPRDVEYYLAINRKRKELGFNFIRFHTHVPPVEYLDACDRLGMLVQIESPNFVEIPEYESIIAFARSHPSVVIYCTGNETRIDDIASAYLKNISDRVHRMSDALFSPMSALRGLEYLLYPGIDDIACEPWPHNPARFAEVRAYSDVFTTYQNSASSYNAINSEYSAGDVDLMGDVYQRPRLAHEICIDGTYMDFSTEKSYPEGSRIIATGVFGKVRENLRRRGLLDRADRYYRNSCEWQRRCRKYCFEKVRSMKRVAGFDFLGDINTHWHTFGYSVGMMDEFYNLKHSETRENVLRYNSPAVLLCNLGSRFCFYAGSRKEVCFSVSNFAGDIASGKLSVVLEDSRGREVFRKTVGGLRAPLGEVCDLSTLTIPFPGLRKPEKLYLKASLESPSVRAENEWEVYVFPRVPDSIVPSDVRVVTDMDKEQLVSAMERGESVLLLGRGPFNSLPASFQIGLPGRTSGNLATVVKSHPCLEGFPHEGFCGWQFCQMMNGSAAVQLEGGIPFDPIVDVASSEKFPIRQSFLFEYAVGKGRLLVCSFNLGADDPSAQYLKSSLVRYVQSPEFRPVQNISVSCLRSALDAPLLRAGANSNVASNVNDPSSLVRAFE